MTPEEYKRLDELLGKLYAELGNQRYCIIPGHVHDGVYMEVYRNDNASRKGGNFIDIKTAVEKLKQS